jgi:hypothetical protein
MHIGRGGVAVPVVKAAALQPSPVLYLRAVTIEKLVHQGAIAGRPVECSDSRCQMLAAKSGFEEHWNLTHGRLYP